MSVTPRSSLARLASAVVAAVLVVPSTMAAPAPTTDQDVWRERAQFPPESGPSEIVVAEQDVAPLLKGLSSREQKSGTPPPAIDVHVVGLDGKGAAGVGVRVGLKVAKKPKPLRLAGATDAQGRLTLRMPGVPTAVKVAIDFAWAGGAKVVGVDLEPDRKGAWRITAAPYKTFGSGEDAGSCKNLFRFEPKGQDAAGAALHELTFAQPDSLLECDSVDYGSERKASELARIDDIGRRDVNAGDKNSFSRDDETKMGLEASSQLDNELEVIDDPAIVGYVDRLTRKIVASSDDPTMPVHVRVVHTDDVNAFVTAGGHVYVFTGLIKAAEDEAELAGVLAHEASHAISRHVTEGATRQTKAQIGTLLGSLAAGAALDLGDSSQQTLMQGSLAAAGVLGMKYDRRAETEADLLGSQYLWNAGWDPESIARFFAVLEAQSQGSPPGWLSSHPSHEKRIENGLHWARAFLPSRDRYLVDTVAFQDVQRRVLALPPPRKRPASPDGSQSAGSAQSLAPVLGNTPTYRAVMGRLLGEASQPTAAPPAPSRR